MTDRTSIEVLKVLNIAFQNQSVERIEEEIETVIKAFLESNPYNNPNILTNLYSVTSNYLKLIVREKNANPNFVLSSVLKYANNYIGLFYIGMLIRNGANPNVYYPVRGYGNLHIIAALAVAVQGTYDPYFRMKVNLLRLLGSDINYPAFKYQNDNDNIDVNFVEKVVDNSPESGYGRSTITVKDFVAENGQMANEDLKSFMNSLETEDLLHVIIAADKIDFFKKILDTNYIDIIKNDVINTTKFFINLSTAGANNIARELTKKQLPYIDSVVNGQPAPLFAATSSMDEDLYSIYIKKGSAIKYLTINHLIIYYKYYKKEEIEIYKNNFNMLLESITIGADIDAYQFDLFASAADFNEIDQLKTAFQVPKWKKLCNVIHEKPRQELKQIAFDLNLDYNMDEKKICNKLKQISLIDKTEYFESAVRRQEDRISAEVASSDEYIGSGKPQISRCSEKSTVIRNPYAYNDARMAFYKDPADGEIWCFTSDMFTSLITSKLNPYNGNPLPPRFLETIKGQVNILKELGVYDTNINIRDALKEVYERTVINNKKTEYAFNTVVKCLSLFGVSEERFSTLKSITQEDTILRDICSVNIKHFTIMSPRHRIMTTARIIYSLSKNKDMQPSELYQEIARAIVGYEVIPEEGEYDNAEQYINMLE